MRLLLLTYIVRTDFFVNGLVNIQFKATVLCSVGVAKMQLESVT